MDAGTAHSDLLEYVNMSKDEIKVVGHLQDKCFLLIKYNNFISCMDKSDIYIYLDKLITYIYFEQPYLCDYLYPTTC